MWTRLAMRFFSAARPDNSQNGRANTHQGRRTRRIASDSPSTFEEMRVPSRSTQSGTVSPILEDAGSLFPLNVISECRSMDDIFDHHAKFEKLDMQTNSIWCHYQDATEYIGR